MTDVEKQAFFERFERVYGNHPVGEDFLTGEDMETFFKASSKVHMVATVKTEIVTAYNTIGGKTYMVKYALIEGSAEEGVVPHFMCYPTIVSTHPEEEEQ